jgi:hypothetical protein
MPRFKSKKITKMGGSLAIPYEEDLEANKANKFNETVLVKEITKVIKKVDNRKKKPIDTSKLLK